MVLEGTSGEKGAIVEHELDGCALRLAPRYNSRNFRIVVTGHTDELAAPICNIVPFRA